MSVKTKMAAFRRGALFVPPAVQCRHRGKFNTKRPYRHFERMVIDEITKPILPKHFIDESKVCPRTTEVPVMTIQSDYEKFVIRQCLKVFEENAMVVFCQTLALQMNEQKVIRNKLFKKGMDLVRFSNPIIRQALDSTKWHNLLPLTHGHNILAVGKESDLHNLVKVMKTTPLLMILGGVVDNRILTNADIMQYAEFPNIDHVRGQLVGMLGTAASRTHSLLSSHQQQLVQNLEQYVKDQTPS